MHAQRLIVESGDKETFSSALKDIIKNSKPDAVGVAGGAIHALWALHGLGSIDTEAVAMGLKNKSPGARRAAASHSTKIRRVFKNIDDSSSRPRSSSPKRCLVSNF